MDKRLRIDNKTGVNFVITTIKLYVPVVTLLVFRKYKAQI